jgi:hypothetical protein
MTLKRRGAARAFLFSGGHAADCVWSWTKWQKRNHSMTITKPARAAYLK